MIKKVIRSSNNVYGEKKKACYMGDYNVIFVGEEPYIHLYIDDERVLTLLCYKNPYQIAKAILGNHDPKQMIKDILGLKYRGLVEGKHFVLTDKGINVRSWMIELYPVTDHNKK